MSGFEDAADAFEKSVWEALQRAKRGEATEQDWKLIELALGL